MVYIYDILLNFSKKLIEFFEWNDNDDILYIKKAPIFHVDSKVIRDFINYNIKIDKSFIDLIMNKTLFYDDYINVNLAILCDGEMALGIKINNGVISGVSRMIFDEEEEVIKLIKRIDKSNIIYNIIDKKNNDFKYLTRYEKRIISVLKDEFTRVYNNNKVDKLNYYYYEYFNKVSNNKNFVYKSLMLSLINDFNDRHLDLYEIIKLSYKKQI